MADTRRFRGVSGAMPNGAGPGIQPAGLADWPYARALGGGPCGMGRFYAALGFVDVRLCANRWAHCRARRDRGAAWLEAGGSGGRGAGRVEHGAQPLPRLAAADDCIGGFGIGADGARACRAIGGAVRGGALGWRIVPDDRLCAKPARPAGQSAGGLGCGGCVCGAAGGGRNQHAGAYAVGLGGVVLSLGRAGVRRRACGVAAIARVACAGGVAERSGVSGGLWRGTGAAGAAVCVCRLSWRGGRAACWRAHCGGTVVGCGAGFDISAGAVGGAMRGGLVELARPPCPRPRWPCRDKRGRGRLAGCGAV